MSRPAPAATAAHPAASAGPNPGPVRTAAPAAPPAAAATVRPDVAATAAPGLASLNDRLRAMIATKPTAHMERVDLGKPSTADDVLSAYEAKLAPPLAVLAKTFGLIYTERTQRHADSIDYVYERMRDVFGHEVCRAFRIIEHPLRPVEQAAVPIGPGVVSFPAPLRDVPPVVETATVSCAAAGFIPVRPGSITTPVPRHKP